jgi:hypothetical protein
VTIKYSFDGVGRQTRFIYLDALGRELHMELVVRGVMIGGNGAQAGLVVDDHILAYNGQAATSVKKLAELTLSSSYPFGAVTIRRGAEIMTLEVERGDLAVNLGLARVEREAAMTPNNSAPADIPTQSR